MKKLTALLLALLLIISSLTGCFNFWGPDPEADMPISLSEIPDFDGKTPYVKVDAYTFTEEEKNTTESFEEYSDLDVLGRCGVATACIGRDIMPTDTRESISSVTPSGWINVEYDIVKGKSLYNRCHLIGFQLTGENANKKNLITGTRFMNVDGMLPFENMVADYVKETENHVMYKVTPVYDGANLVASGVIMEAYSVEDDGAGISFCVYVYNNQPGIVIDYKTGKSRLATDAEFPTEQEPSPPEEPNEDAPTKYIITVSTKKFHTPDCYYAQKTSTNNKREEVTTKSSLISAGNAPCSVCIK